MDEELLIDALAAHQAFAALYGFDSSGLFCWRGHGDCRDGLSLGLGVILSVGRGLRLVVVVGVVKDMVEARQVRDCKRCRFHVPSFFLLFPVTGRRKVRLVERADFTFTALSSNDALHLATVSTALALLLRVYGSCRAISKCSQVSVHCGRCIRSVLQIALVQCSARMHAFPCSSQSTRTLLESRMLLQVT